MPKTKQTSEEELPKEEISEEEVPKVGLKPTTQLVGDKETQWEQIETEVESLKDDFIAGRITLDEVIDRLIASLSAMKTAKTTGLRGLGVGPEMEFPTEEEPTATSEPEEETPPASVA